MHHSIHGVLGLLLAGALVAQDSTGGALDLMPDTRFPASWGQVFRGSVASKALAHERAFQLYLPASHAVTRRRYPTVFVTDGDYNFADVVTALRQLAAVGHVPECIAVGVSTKQRTQDLTPPGMDAYIAEGEARGERLLQFLAEELAPALAPQRAGRPFVLLGHSHGAILCHHAAAAWRKQFPFVVALDCPMTLSDRWLSRRLVGSVGDGGHLRLVSLETRFGWSDGAWRDLVAAAPADWQLTRRRMTGDDHVSMVFEGYFSGLRTVFADYSAVAMRDASGPQVCAHYGRLAASYGEEPMPPLPLLQRTLMDLVIRGERDMARHLLKLMREAYDEPADPADVERRVDAAAEAMRGKPTVEDLLAAPPPSLADMKPYLGVWKGWVGFEGHRPPNTVTFRVNGDRIEGTVEIQETSTDRQTLAITYLHVTEQGIEFGFMNGMYPRGMLVHATRREGNRLLGKVELRGVHFEPPPGHTPPVYEIQLERAAPSK